MPRDRTKKEDGCSETVPAPYTFAGKQCENKAKVKVGGRWYCHIHDPEKVKEREQKSMAKYDAESKERARKFERRQLVDAFCFGVGNSFLRKNKLVDMIEKVGE